LAAQVIEKRFPATGFLDLPVLVRAPKSESRCPRAAAEILSPRAWKRSASESALMFGTEPGWTGLAGLLWVWEVIGAHAVAEVSTAISCHKHQRESSHVCQPLHRTLQGKVPAQLTEFLFERHT